MLTILLLTTNFTSNFDQIYETKHKYMLFITPSLYTHIHLIRVHENNLIYRILY